MFSDPQKIIDQCSIQAGMEIADFGAGSGFYTVASAKALISTGRVYAIDAQKDLLTKLKNHTAREGLYNVEVIWGDIEKIGGTHLKDASIDLVLMCNVIFQLEDKLAAIVEMKRVLKSGGRVLLVDWAESFGGIGPKSDVIFKKQNAIEMFEKNGFHLDMEVSAGAHHYGLIFKKL